MNQKTEKKLYTGKINKLQFAPLRGLAEYYGARLLLLSAPILLDIFVNDGRATRWAAHMVIDALTQLSGR